MAKKNPSDKKNDPNNNQKAMAFEENTLVCIITQESKKVYDERRKEICIKNRDTYRRRFWVGVKERNTEKGLKKIAGQGTF